MGKIKQRNWLIIITVFLVIVSGLALLVSIQKKLSFSSCAYGDEIYKSGDVVPDYTNGSNCLCNSDGAIKCDNSNSTSNYDGFSSANLTFTYNYLNLLDNNTVMKENVLSTSASYVNNILTVKLERNVLCSSGNAAPAQSGFYQLTDNGLKLMVMTDKDTSKYVYPCRIENTFVIVSLNLSLNENFKIHYQNENGEMVDLEECVYNNMLYGDQEVFKSQDLNSVCICNSGKVSCKDLQ